MEQNYLLYTPYTNIGINDKSYKFKKDLYVLLRSEVLNNEKFSWQEVCLFLDSFIIMQKHLNIGKGQPDYDEKRVSDLLIKLYEEYYKESIDKRFEYSHLYSVPNFVFLIKHLQGEKKLGTSIKILLEEIHNRQTRFENYNENDIVELWDCINEYSPIRCLDNLTELNVLSHMETLYIKRNNKQSFFTVPEGSFIDSLNDLDEYDPSNIAFVGVKEFKEVSCIWPFSYGYARVLSRNGIWGDLSVETTEIIWLKENVLYAFDFKCERARIQLNNDFEKYCFIDLCLNECFSKTFNEAQDFNNGETLVSDDYCRSYRIDVLGNIITEDLEKYEKSKKKSIDDSIKSKQLFNKSRKQFISYDGESEIMDSLCGYGADPEIYGF